MSAGLNLLKAGCLALVFCCIFYLIWWSAAFHPTKKYPMRPKVILFLCTLAAGILGVICTLRGILNLPAARPGLSAILIVIIGVIAYFILLYVTNRFLHRQVTTELLLIAGWSVMELCVMNSLYRAAVLDAPSALLWSGIILFTAASALFCYLAYYRLPPEQAFRDGMIPLLSVGFLMAMIWLMLL